MDSKKYLCPFTLGILLRERTDIFSNVEIKTFVSVKGCKKLEIRGKSGKGK